MNADVQPKPEAINERIGNHNAILLLIQRRRVLEQDPDIGWAIEQRILAMRRAGDNRPIGVVPASGD